MTIAQWLQQLSQAESLWVETAREAELPDFEGTVIEYHSLSESESISSTPSEASFSEDDRWNVPVGVVRKVSNVVKPGVGVGLRAAHELGPDRIAKALEAL